MGSSMTTIQPLSRTAGIFSTCLYRYMLTAVSTAACLKASGLSLFDRLAARSALPPSRFGEGVFVCPQPENRCQIAHDFTRKGLLPSPPPFRPQKALIALNLFL